MDFAGEAYRQRLERKRQKRVLSERARVEKLPKKPLEWSLDRAILNLGAYFETTSSTAIKQAEKRRQYGLITPLIAFITVTGLIPCRSVNFNPLRSNVSCRTVQGCSRSFVRGRGDISSSPLRVGLKTRLG